jgi:hypothetical protein
LAGHWTVISACLFSWYCVHAKYAKKPAEVTDYERSILQKELERMEEIFLRETDFDDEDTQERNDILWHKHQRLARLLA